MRGQGLHNQEKRAASQRLHNISRRTQSRRGINHRYWQKVKNNLDIRLRHRFTAIRHRCENPHYPAYKWYGAKGIRNFLTLADLYFLWKRDRAHKLKRPSIDRIDPKGDYSVSNCRFIEHSINIKNSWKGDQSVRMANRRAAVLRRRRFSIATERRHHEAESI